MFKVNLDRSQFSKVPAIIASNGEFKAEAFRYDSGIESVKLYNSKGYVEILPFMGQIIWDLHFAGRSLKLHNIFDMPRKAQCITDTYGCFAFHSGLLANGCPAPEDSHPMHGEFSVADINEAWLELDEQAGTIALCSRYHYCKGFEFHYDARPKVVLAAGKSRIEIVMQVQNLTACPMPLQYMCHINYAYLPNAQISSNIPNEAFKLRESIPSHVHPTEKWLAYNEKLKAEQAQGRILSKLDAPEMYDPEIVFMADNVAKYAEQAEFTLSAPDDLKIQTCYSTKDFPCATRWIMYNPDLQVAAFVLPATCRPEGFNAAKKAGTLIYLQTGESRTFRVSTGLKEE